MNTGAQIGIIVVASAVLAGGLTSAIVLSQRSSEPPPPAWQVTPLERSARSVENKLQIPPFELVDHNDRTVTNSIFDGHITIVDFVFTHCPLACPIMTDRMKLLTETLRGTNVQFVSFSIDPERDPPERLREYRELQGIKTQRWTFVTDPEGNAEATRSLATEGLLAGIEEDQEYLITLPDGTDMPNIIHGTFFYLIGPNGEVLDFFQSTDEDELLRLERWAGLADQTIGG